MADINGLRTWEGVIGPLGACIVLAARSDLPEGEKSLVITDGPPPSLTLRSKDGVTQAGIELDWENGGFLEKIKSVTYVAIMEPPPPGIDEPTFYFASIEPNACREDPDRGE